MKVAYGSMAHIGRQNSVATNYTGRDAVSTLDVSANSNGAFPMVELHVSARNLKDMDIITVSDPICVLYLHQDGQWTEFARTEVVWNNLNPEWVTFFTILYVFEIRQPLLFRVFDVDSDKADLKKQDFIGEAMIDLSQIVSSPGTTELHLRLPNKTEHRGTLCITPEQVENCASVVEGQIVADKLKKLRALFKNDPFFVIGKAAENGKFLPVYQSEVDRKMQWKPFKVPYQVLCNVDPDRPLRITFFDYRSTKAAVPIGYYDTTFSRMSERVQQPLAVKDDKGKDMGTFRLKSIALAQKASFYDYIRGGVQLNLVTAIDFTASNGDPAQPSSLHFFRPGGDSLNQYEQCIRAVGEILCPYDSDQLFPVLGFGAKVAGRVEHCFPLTFNPQAPCVQGLEGIIGAYQNALRQVGLSGPTLFSHVIRYASQLAVAAWQESRTYTILLIITDGVINDMQDTKDAIVDAGRLPLSIVIVGVGNADFSAMDVLDADDVPLVSRAGYKMARDLVQFVPFNKYASKHYSVLASQVLDEIPRQLCEWADMNGVRPSA